MDESNSRRFEDLGSIPNTSTMTNTTDTTRPRKHVFLVAVMKRDPHTGNTRQRTWGWYTNFPDAERAVVENHTDIFEANYYNLAVIEEIPEGVMAIAKNAWWYQATYSGDPQEVFNPQVQRIQAPDWSRHQFNFTL